MSLQSADSIYYILCLGSYQRHNSYLTYHNLHSRYTNAGVRNFIKHLYPAIHCNGFGSSPIFVATGAASNKWNIIRHYIGQIALQRTTGHKMSTQRPVLAVTLLKKVAHTKQRNCSPLVFILIFHPYIIHAQSKSA